MAEPVHYFVVSKRPAFRELVRFVLEWRYVCKVETSDSEAAALEYLRHATVFPNMIIYDYEPDAFLVEDFILSVKESRKPVQFLVLAEKIHEKAQGWFESLPTFHLVQRQELWNNVFRLTHEAFAEHEQDNTDPWCRIHLDAYASLGGLARDLYLKMASGKMLRLFEGGAAGSEDVEKYRGKGVAFLWLERPTCDWVVDQVQRQFHVFLANRQFQFVIRPPDAPKEEQFEQKILRVCGELHMDPEFQREIQVLMDKVLEVVQRDVRLGSIVRLLKSQDPRLSYFAREMQLMSFISCYLAKAMEWHSKQTLEKLVYASILHDITIAHRPHLQRLTGLAEFERVKGELSPEDQELFLQHPKEAASLLKANFKFAPPETEVLVLQHHEMPDGSGFPGKIQGDRFSPLVQLYIVTHDFVRFVMNQSEPDLEEYLLRAEAKFSQHAFRRYITLLKKLKTRS